MASPAFFAGRPLELLLAAFFVPAVSCLLSTPGSRVVAAPTPPAPRPPSRKASEQLVVVTGLVVGLVLVGVAG